MNCPVCGSPIRQNKGWAAQFYDGYCNTCDAPVEVGVDSGEEDGDEETICCEAR